MEIHEEFTKWALERGVKINCIAAHRFEGRGLGIIAEKEHEVCGRSNCLAVYMFGFCSSYLLSVLIFFFLASSVQVVRLLASTPRSPQFMQDIPSRRSRIFAFTKMHFFYSWGINLPSHFEMYVVFRDFLYKFSSKLQKSFFRPVHELVLYSLSCPAFICSLTLSEFWNVFTWNDHIIHTCQISCS